MMNMPGVTAHIIYSSNNKLYKMKRRLSLREHLQRRNMESNVPPNVRERKQEVAGTSEVQVHE